MSLPEQIDEATKYIQKLQAQLERLEEKRSGLANAAAGGMRSDIHRACAGRGLKPPRVEIHLAGDSALQLVLITGADCHFIFIEAIRVLHEEGAEVVNASFSVMDESTVYHTIHAKIQECSKRQVEVAIARINERLNRFCN